MKMIRLKTPLSKEQIKKLKINDKILISGTIFTARDKAHKFLLKNNQLKNRLNNCIIYHCGPIIKKRKIVSAGPTSSVRLNKYEPDIIKKYNIKAIIGKGGMDKKTVAACKKHRCIYLSATGGAAAILAKSIKKIKNVYKLDFGVPEAIWELEVENFPAVVTIDANGNSLHNEILKKSEKEYKKLIR